MHERDLAEMVHMDIEDGALRVGYDEELLDELDDELCREANAACAACNGNCSECHFANSEFCCFA